MRRITYLLLLSSFFLVIFVWLTPLPKKSHHLLPPTSNQTSVLGARTKSTGCVINNARPDPDCTPGSAIPAATADLVCVRGYSATVRDVTESVKNQVYAEYSITSHFTGEYEVDHLISLELGGSNDISNLWPEAAEPRPGFHEKDQVENYLHEQVCNGNMTLKAAQDLISHDWTSVIIP